MKVEIGKCYEICNPHIAGVVKTCFMIDVKNEQDIMRVKAYIDSRRSEVRELKLNNKK
jgi:hypothetical protein